MMASKNLVRRPYSNSLLQWIAPQRARYHRGTCTTSDPHRNCRCGVTSGLHQAWLTYARRAPLSRLLLHAAAHAAHLAHGLAHLHSRGLLHAHTHTTHRHLERSVCVLAILVTDLP